MACPSPTPSSPRQQGCVYARLKAQVPLSPFLRLGTPVARERSRRRSGSARCHVHRRSPTPSSPRQLPSVHGMPVPDTVFFGLPPPPHHFPFPDNWEACSALDETIQDDGTWGGWRCPVPTVESRVDRGWTSEPGAGCQHRFGFSCGLLERHVLIPKCRFFCIYASQGI